jgi:hypothetical protein
LRRGLPPGHGGLANQAVRERTLRAYRDPALAWSFLRPLVRELDAHCVGSLSEVFYGDLPFTPRACIAQAWSVADVLQHVELDPQTSFWIETAVPA